jgi:hypothetical protein
MGSIRKVPMNQKLTAAIEGAKKYPKANISFQTVGSLTEG